MFFLQPNVCASERTPHAPSLMLQVAGRGYAHLLRKPIRRSSLVLHFLRSSASEHPPPPRPLCALLSLSDRRLGLYPHRLLGALCGGFWRLLSRGFSLGDARSERSDDPSKLSTSRLFGV